MPNTVEFMFPDKWKYAVNDSSLGFCYLHIVTQGCDIGTVDCVQRNKETRNVRLTVLGTVEYFLENITP